MEYSETANDREKYATYTRDSVTGLDYAMNRYYSSEWGRFTSPDPYGGSASPSSPQSWNRYAYAGNDSVNSSDPSGLNDWGWCPPGWICVGGWPGTGTGNGGVAGGGSSFGGNGHRPCVAVAGRIRVDPFFHPCGSGGGSSGGSSGGGNPSGNVRASLARLRNLLANDPRLSRVALEYVFARVRWPRALQRPVQSPSWCGHGLERRSRRRPGPRTSERAGLTRRKACLAAGFYIRAEAPMRRPDQRRGRR